MSHRAGARTPELRVAVVGSGWAGLSAAVEATQRGHHVTLFEMAAQPGGRARAVSAAGMLLDNGQHILIGAYSATLALMRAVGVEPEHALLRSPLRLAYPDGIGLMLEPGLPIPQFARAVLRLHAWPWRDRIALLWAASRWAARGFRCDPLWTVARLTAALPASVRRDLIDPLCVAALNTPSAAASASVFLRVLKDALFSGAGSADLLLPRSDLSHLLPDPALRWLAQAGAELRIGHRVQAIEVGAATWQVDGEPFDHVVLATTATEAARLAEPHASDWARTARAMRYEPIVTVYLRSAGARLPEPMLALRADAQAPAQFVFDRGQLGGATGLLAFVVSGAAEWVARGQQAVLDATMAQAHTALGAHLNAAIEPVQVLVDKRATFACTPGLARPTAFIAKGLHAAGDYVAGPYPATLEGAVRSGVVAAAAISAVRTAPPAAHR